MTYYLYHIPGKKIGVTRDLKERVERQQGYEPGEYGVLTQTDDIDLISRLELKLQEAYGYRVDMIPYNKLKFNNNNMNINVTEMTTTFPCPVNKLKGRLKDNLGMSWETDHGNCIITDKSIEWIMDNVKSSQFTQERCYIYNKAFARWFDNNNAYNHMFDNAKQMNEVEAKRNGTLTGALAPTGVRQNGIEIPQTHFDLIRKWASKRGLYKKGDPKTQALKLVEEVGETCRAILKGNQKDIEDGIGDAVVVLTNLAHLCNTDIEHCIELAYNEIKDRTGKMDNGTFKKD
jgi:NTP pyrophosphatase (non-canonical NTP hydrolase)